MSELLHFNELYVSFFQKSILFVKSYVHNQQEAEDIATESLFKLWERMKEDTILNPSAFLLTILKNKSLDYLKHEMIKQEALETINQLNRRDLDIRISTLQACDPDEIFSSELQCLIADALDSLPVQTREVFHLSRFENKSNKEIAEIKRITIKGVEYHITKALKSLREELKDYLPLILFFLLSR